MATSSKTDDDEGPQTPTNKLDRLETEIEDLCRSLRNEEVSEHELQEHFLDFSSEQLKFVVNRMIKARKLQVRTDEQHRASIRLRDPGIVRKLLGVEDDELRAYEIIEAVGNKGIASKFIRFKTKASTTRMLKMLTALESKQLIKAVKLQKNTQHVKSYILFHLKLDDPSASGINSVFGSGAGFDTPLFEMVCKLCLVFLKQRMKEFIALKSSGAADPLSLSPSEASAEDVLSAVLETGAVKAELTEDSIDAVMKMLELNGKVEKRQYMEDEALVARYRLHSTRGDKPEAAIPCVGCPVKHLCSLDSPVNPLDCPHFDSWWRKINV